VARDQRVAPYRLTTVRCSIPDARRPAHSPPAPAQRGHGAQRPAPACTTPLPPRSKLPARLWAFRLRRTAVTRLLAVPVLTEGLVSVAERSAVEVKIGIQCVPRELVVDTISSSEEVQRALAAALADRGVFTLADDKGGKVMVPADKIAYIELSDAEPRRIGFGNTL